MRSDSISRFYSTTLRNLFLKLWVPYVTGPS